MGSEAVRPRKVTPYIRWADHARIEALKGLPGDPILGVGESAVVDVRQQFVQFADSAARPLAVAQEGVKSPVADSRPPRGFAEDGEERLRQPRHWSGLAQ